MRTGQATLILGLLLCLTAIFAPAPARGQGCSQCRDTVSQTNPAVQSSYREAILLLMTAALGIGTATFVIFRRMR